MQAANEIRRAVDMQHRSYLLLKWMATAVKQGFIDFKIAHKYSTLPEAAADWIHNHYLNIPANARPASEDISQFSEFFSTYLKNSFDLVANPGKQLYSPAAHCFCPICSWLVDAPNLKAKKITPTDKRRAEKLKTHAVKQIAIDHLISISESEIEEILKDGALNEQAALIAYGFDLRLRMQGIANGPAILALWRGFAWTQTGSPKSKFRLTADMITQAEQQIIETLRHASRN